MYIAAMQNVPATNPTQASSLNPCSLAAYRGAGGGGGVGGVGGEGRRWALDVGVVGRTADSVSAHRVLRASTTGVKRSLSSAAMWDAHFLAVSTRAWDS